MNVKVALMALRVIHAAQIIFLVQHNVFRAHSPATLSMEIAVLIVLITA